MIRIASIDNLSARAYRLSAPDFDHSLRFETPARVNALMAAGHCDVALVPVAALPVLGRTVEAVGEFGIACTGPVRSVQLFSEVRVAGLLAAGRPIYATPKSRTSVELFKILCLRQYGKLPTLTSSYAEGAAHLLIGDAAFEYAQRNGSGPHNIDLGGWWFAQTGLPFVYARWVVSTALDKSRKAHVLDWLASCADKAATEAGQEALVQGLEMAPEDRLALQIYYQRLRARLFVSDVAAQFRFLHLMEGYANVHAAPVA